MPAGSSAVSLVWEPAAVMAMFEQMRANVGKLLKGIDRSEPGRRERFWPRRVEERVFWSQQEVVSFLGLPGGGIFSVILEQLFKRTALYRPEGRRWSCLPLSSF